MVYRWDFYTKLSKYLLRYLNVSIDYYGQWLSPCSIVASEQPGLGTLVRVMILRRSLF